MSPNSIVLTAAIQASPELAKQVDLKKQVVADEIGLQTATASWDRVADSLAIPAPIQTDPHAAFTRLTSFLHGAGIVS